MFTKLEPDILLPVEQKPLEATAPFGPSDPGLSTFNTSASSRNCYCTDLRGLLERAPKQDVLFLQSQPFCQLPYQMFWGTWCGYCSCNLADVCRCGRCWMMLIRMWWKYAIHSFGLGSWLECLPAVRLCRSHCNLNGFDGICMAPRLIMCAHWPLFHSSLGDRSHFIGCGWYAIGMEDFSPEDQHDRHDSHIQPQSLLVMPNLQSFLRQNFKICFDRRVGFRWTIYLIAAWSTGTVGPREWLLLGLGITNYNDYKPAYSYKLIAMWMKMRWRLHGVRVAASRSGTTLQAPINFVGTWPLFTGRLHRDLAQTQCWLEPRERLANVSKLRTPIHVMFAAWGALGADPPKVHTWIHERPASEQHEPQRCFLLDVEWMGCRSMYQKNDLDLRFGPEIPIAPCKMHEHHNFVQA